MSMSKSSFLEGKNALLCTLNKPDFTYGFIEPSMSLGGKGLHR